MRALALLLLAACTPTSYGDLEGRVIIDGAEDHSGVTVRAVGPLSASTATDSAGRYQLPGLPPGAYALSFTADSTLEEQQIVRAEVPAAVFSAPEVRFTAVGSIEGVVTLGGVPGGGAVVFVEGASAVATSDGNGHYLVNQVPAGLRAVEAVLSGYRLGRVEGIAVERGRVAPAARLDLEIDGDPPYPVAALAGQALRLGRDDHSGTTVVASRGSTRLTTTTGKDGSYYFDGLPTGLYSLDFSYDGLTETIPQVVALAGSTGQVVDGALYPLEAHPLHLPEARRLASDAQLLQVLDGERALVSQKGGIDRNDQTLQLLSLLDGSRTTLVNDSNRVSNVVVAKSLARLLYSAGVGSREGVLRSVRLDGSPAFTLSDRTDSYGYRYSLDEAFVLYRSGSEVHSVPSGGGTSTLLASGVSNSEAQLHPDGKRVVYQSCQDTACQLSVRSIDGGPPTDLLSGPGPFYVAPDGGHVVLFANYDFNNSKAQLWVASIDGTGARKLWDGVIYLAVSFSPDGRRLAFLTDTDDLRLFELGSNDDPPTVADKVQTFAFSPDGSRLLYQTDYQAGPRTYDLKQQPVTGGAEVRLGTRLESYSVSLDGTHTLFVDGIDAASRLGSLKVADATGKVTTLLPAGAFSGAHITNDGKRVLYRTEHPTRTDLSLLWSVPITGGTPIKLGEMLSYLGPDSPSGAQVAWTGPDEMVHAASTSSGASARVVGIGYPQWVSDSRLLLSVTQNMPPYRHQNGLYVFEVTP